MLSAVKIKQNDQHFDYWYYQVEFRINDHNDCIRCFSINSLDQVFNGEDISFKKAITNKTKLQCFIDFGGDYRGDFHIAGSVSLTLEHDEKEIYIGLLWIEPEFRGNDLASYIISEIVNFADELGIILALHAVPFINLNIKPIDKDIFKLKKYYERFGFRDNFKARTSGFCCLMERLPRTKAIV